jgi:hypothetical protein
MPRRMLQTAPLGFAVNGGFGSAADLQVNPTNFLPWVSPNGHLQAFASVVKRLQQTKIATILMIETQIWVFSTTSQYQLVPTITTRVKG